MTTYLLATFTPDAIFLHRWRESKSKFETTAILSPFTKALATLGPVIYAITGDMGQSTELKRIDTTVEWAFTEDPFAMRRYWEL